MISFQVAGLQFLMDDELAVLANQMNYLPFVTEQVFPKEDVLFEMETGSIPNTCNQSILASYTNETGSFKVGVQNEEYDWHLKRPGDDRIYRMLLNLKTKKAVLDFEIADAYAIQAANDFVRFAFIYTSAFHNTILLHASCIRCNDKGIAFIGPSGIGKSTHSSLWLQYIPKAELINDDQPAVRIIDGHPVIFGTPWSGKTNCYKQKHADLNVILCMKQETQNLLKPMNRINLFTQLLPACSLMRADKKSSTEIFKTLATIAEQVRSATLENKADQESVSLSSRFLLNNFYK